MRDFAIFIDAVWMGYFLCNWGRELDHHLGTSSVLHKVLGSGAGPTARAEVGTLLVLNYKTKRRANLQLVWAGLLLLIVCLNVVVDLTNAN